MEKILVVDNSALMRKVMCDIINSMQGFTAADTCADVDSAFDKIVSGQVTGVTFNMAIDATAKVSLFEKLTEAGILIPIVVITTATREDRAMTMEVMGSGAMEFVVRPFQMKPSDREVFSREFQDSLISAFHKKGQVANVAPAKAEKATEPPKEERPARKPGPQGPIQLVALACSTGGPQALHTMIPMINKKLGVPMVIVQHMPVGFTEALAERLNEKSILTIKEAEDNEELLPDHVYIAPGGKHLEVADGKGGRLKARVYDGPPVRALRPCADVMYESLNRCNVSNILCVVLTGMGSDGTIGITSLSKNKHIYVITQDEETCVVYGMPKAVKKAGFSNEEHPITEVAHAILKKLGV